MAFIMEYIEREGLDKLNLNSEKIKIGERLFWDYKDRDLWEEFGDSKVIYIDEERDMWLLYLAHKVAIDASQMFRYTKEHKEDMFLFNYKGDVVYVTLQVTDDSKAHYIERPYNATYKFVELNPPSLKDIDENQLKKLICEALATTTFNSEDSGMLNLVITGKLDNMKPIKCKMKEI